MKILIIGSKGFIGSHALNFFRKTNALSVWGCDVVTDYTDKNYFLVDATNSDFESFFQVVHFDIVINCSGAASVPDSIKNPVRDFYLNTNNVIKILDGIRKNSQSCRFINLSSAAVYGNPQKLPVSESDLINPVSPYGSHKFFAEKLCKEYFEYFNIPSCSLRIFSAYGPGLRKQIFWDIYQKSLQSENINLFGTGKETRDFIYISDIVKAIKNIITKGEFTGIAYNVASGIETCIKDTAELLAQELGYQGNIFFSGDERLGDPINWVADISRLKKLGFEPEYSISEGIKKYVQWLKEERLH